MVNIVEEQTALKFRNFVSQPIGDKSVKELPGVGEAVGNRLMDFGYDKAYLLLGQFLLLRQNEHTFRHWFMQISNADAKQAYDCSNCLKTWTHSFL